VAGATGFAHRLAEMGLFSQAARSEATQMFGGVGPDGAVRDAGGGLVFALPFARRCILCGCEWDCTFFHAENWRAASGADWRCW